MEKKFDFSGWATRNNLRCSDGRTIRQDAFKDNDGQTVPLVWNHQHNGPSNVLGHALLENRSEGVYAYCTFNDTESGQDAKLLVQHGDVKALSIYANRLKQNGGDVLHGAIREVSLVLAGANPGAFIDTVLQHGDGTDEEAIIYTGEDIFISHADEEEKKMPENKGETVQDVFDTLNEKQKKVVYAMIGMALEEKNGGGEAAHSDMYHADAEEGDGETVQDVFNTLSEKQKKVVYALIGMALEQKGGNTAAHSDYDGGSEMKKNVFDDMSEEKMGGTLSHAETEAIFAEAKATKGSLRATFLEHGITNIDVLFPDAQAVRNTPDWVMRDNEWVSSVMKGTHHTPFSRIKSMYANITADEARAKGFVKGNQKMSEVFGLFKRTTTPQTVYKLQKLDRDDVIDITSLDVVAWLKGEMRMMLEEEIARAILVGDGRDDSSDDKINPLNIRPIWTDNDVYTIKTAVEVPANATESQIAKAAIRAIVKSRKNYKGSGNPVFYTTEDVLTDMLLLEDNNGRVIYDTEEKLRTALRVSKIVTVPVMENLHRQDLTNDYALMGLIVNLTDYTVGADKGGAVSMFDDFDIDYNKNKYLIETRVSGALTRPYSAIAIELKGELPEVDDEDDED